MGGELPTTRTSMLNFQKTLKIMEVTEADAGNYRCTAKNHLGSVDHTIQVTVKSEMDNMARSLHSNIRSLLHFLLLIFKCKAGLIIWGADVLSVNNTEY